MLGFSLGIVESAVQFAYNSLDEAATALLRATSSEVSSRQRPLLKAAMLEGTGATRPGGQLHVADERSALGVGAAARQMREAQDDFRDARAAVMKVQTTLATHWHAQGLGAPRAALGALKQACELG